MRCPCTPIQPRFPPRWIVATHRRRTGHVVGQHGGYEHMPGHRVERRAPRGTAQRATPGKLIDQRGQARLPVLIGQRHAVTSNLIRGQASVPVRHRAAPPARARERRGHRHLEWEVPNVSPDDRNLAPLQLRARREPDPDPAVACVCAAHGLVGLRIWPKRPPCFKSDNTPLTSKNRLWRRIPIHNPLYPGLFGVRGDLARLRRLDDHLGGADTFNLYVAEADKVASLIKAGNSATATRRELHALYAEQAQQAGWAAFDAGWQQEATRMFESGYGAARKAGCSDLAGNALALRSYQLLSSGTLALELTDKSLTVAAKSVHPAVKSLLYQRGAWTYAVAGNTE